MSEKNEKQFDSNYFGSKQEQGVIEYIKVDTQDEKQRIYLNILKRPFKTMIESILLRYPIYMGSYDRKELEHNALTHLIENMGNFSKYIIEFRLIGKSRDDDWKKNKKLKFNDLDIATSKLNELLMSDINNEYRMKETTAYAYCGTIVRNFFINHSKKTYGYEKSRMDFTNFNDEYKNESLMEEIHKNNEYVTEINLELEDPVEQLFSNIIESIENQIAVDDTLKENEIKVGNAIVYVLKNWSTLFMENSEVGKYQKKVTNNYMKQKTLYIISEITMMSTKEMRQSMKKFKDIYLFLKEEMKMQVDKLN